jgi:hypothetical protein
VDRLWNRIAVRAASVGLLAGGLTGGVYIGQQQGVQARDGQAGLVAWSEVEEMRLLKARHGQHAAARAYQREAEDQAATVAAAEAKAAAGKARRLAKKAIEKKAADKRAAEAKSSGATVPYTGPIPSSCGEFSGNRATGCALMLNAGFKIDQFPCLNKLWTKESGWNHRAENSGSGAYGIPQAYPGSKMGSVASDWRTNPATQIKWGLGYIKGRYDTPCGAWSHFQNSGSY